MPIESSILTDKLLQDSLYHDSSSQNALTQNALIYDADRQNNLFTCPCIILSLFMVIMTTSILYLIILHNP